MNPVINIFSYRDVSDPEDVFILHYRKGGVIDACVADGVSGFHSPRVPNRWFRDDAGGRLTGGQAVGKILQGRFLNPPEEDSLADILLKANADMAAFARRHGIPLDRPDDLPAIHIAAARLREDQIDIITTGDCFAVWALRSTRVGATPNLEWEFTSREQPEFQRLESLHGSREQAWTYIEASFRQWRRELTNVTYATLNGQQGIDKLWYRTALPSPEVEALLLFTDGFITPEDTHDEIRMGQRVLDSYRQRGWSAVLAAKRTKKVGEATAIAIEFQG